jgi:CHAT domain-containing protein
MFPCRVLLMFLAFAPLGSTQGFRPLDPDMVTPGSGPEDPDARAMYEYLYADVQKLKTEEELALVLGATAEFEKMLEGRQGFWAAYLHSHLAYAMREQFQNLEGAEREYALARDGFEHTGYPLWTGYSAQNHASTLEEMGRVEEAIDEMRGLVEFYAALDKGIDVAENQINLANALARQGKFDEALEQLESPSMYFRSIEDWGGLSYCLNSRSAILMILERYLEASSSIEEHGSLGRAEGGMILVRALAQRGNYLQNVHRYEEAVVQFVEARALVEAAGVTDWVAKMDSAIAVNLTEAGRNEEASDHYLAALTVFRPDYLADDWWDTQLNYATLLETLGDLVGSEGRLEALRGWDPEREADLLRNLASVHFAMGRVEDAQGELDQAWGLEVLLGHKESMAAVCESRAEILRHGGEHAAAIHQYTRASTLLEELQRTQLLGLGEKTSFAVRSQFRSTLSGAVASLAGLTAAEAGPREEVYHVLQTFRSATMYGLMAERGQESLDRVPADLREDYEVALGELAAIEAERAGVIGANLGRFVSEKRSAEIREAREALAPLEERQLAALTRIEAIEEGIRARNRAYAAVQYPRPATAEEVRSTLAPDTSLVEYVWGDEAVCAFVLTREELSFHRLAASDEADALLEEATAQIAAGDAEIGSTLAAVGARLLEPLRPVLKGKTLLVAPDGALCLFPLEAARLAAGEGTRERYVIEEYDLAYVHSGTVFRESVLASAEARAPAGRFVALGDPRPGARVGVAEGAGRLEGTATEALVAARLATEDEGLTERLADALEALAGDPDGFPEEALSSDDVTVVLGPLASESFLKSDPRVRDSEVLHLGCHGVADTRAPELSRLHLSADATEDGMLTLRELSRLDLSADLVVLSACETNGGRVEIFEGATGFARAALMAGARSVISTMWRVNDEHALALMNRFYVELFVRETPPLRALAEAKRQSIDERVPVGSWAGYVIWDTDR